MDSKNMIIGVLSLTAVVLLCTLVLVHSALRQPGPGASLAWADTVDRGGDYVLATGAFTDVDEVLYALDGSRDRLNAYQYDQNRKGMILYDSVDLTRYFGSGTP